MAAPPIYNPVVPCIHIIPGGMYPGKMIRVQGTVPMGAYRFAFNLQCGPNTDPRDDIALHLNFRFPEACVVRNHLTAMNWGPEETAGGIPINRGESFEALILCEHNSIKVALNGMHFCEFIHRVPYQRISHLTVDGDVMLTFIGFEGGNPPPTSEYMTRNPHYGPGMNQQYQQPGMHQQYQQPGMNQQNQPPHMNQPHQEAGIGMQPQYQQPGYAQQGYGPPAYGAPPPTYGAPGYGPPQGYQQQQMQPQQASYTGGAYAQPQARSGMGTGAAVGLGVGALAAGGLAGYALAGGFSGGDSPPRDEVQVASFSEGVDFGGDDWME